MTAGHSQYTCWLHLRIVPPIANPWLDRAAFPARCSPRPRCSRRLVESRRASVIHLDVERGGATVGIGIEIARATGVHRRFMGPPLFGAPAAGREPQRCERRAAHPLLHHRLEHLARSANRAPTFPAHFSARTRAELGTQWQSSGIRVAARLFRQRERLLGSAAARGWACYTSRPQ